MGSVHSPWLWLLLALVVGAGCSRSEPAEVAETSAPVSGALTSTLPVVTLFETSGSQAEHNDEPVTPFEENLDFFSPPAMIVPPEPEEPLEDRNGELPPLRLVGFVGAAGDKAMVAIDGKMHIVTAGKQLNGVEIVSVKSPDVELRWGETAVTLNFFEPGKADRGKPRQVPSLTGSLGPQLTRGPAFSPERSSQEMAAKPLAATAPRPRISLPSLPSLPSPPSPPGLSVPGNTASSDHGDFPDLGDGLDAPPAL